MMLLYQIVGKGAFAHLNGEAKYNSQRAFKTREEAEENIPKFRAVCEAGGIFDIGVGEGVYKIAELELKDD
jgi:hypothetical protein